MIREWIEPDDVWDRDVIITIYCLECGYQGDADAIARFRHVIEATCPKCDEVQEVDEWL